MPRLIKATLAALLLVSLRAAASDLGPRFVFDPAPEPGMPAEAIRAQRSASSEREATSKVVQEKIDSVTVRYFSLRVFRDPAQAERYVRRLLAMRNGYTTRIIHWAEGLGTPSIEASLWLADAPGRGRLIVWPGRAASQDSRSQWWFTSWSQEEEQRLLER